MTPRPEVVMPDSGPGVSSGTSGGGSLCGNSRLDAVLRTKAGDSYVFRGDQYWKLTSDR